MPAGHVARSHTWEDRSGGRQVQNIERALVFVLKQGDRLTKDIRGYQFLRWDDMGRLCEGNQTITVNGSGRLRERG